MGRGRSWTDEELAIAVAKSFSIRNVIKLLGLVPAGGNYKQINERILILNLNISHFTGAVWNKGKNYQSKAARPIEEFLCIGSKIGSHRLKRRLFHAGLKSPVCERCGWAEQSKDGRIPVELDHINGNHEDNRLENLQILCPNCHSLQPTHRGRNKKLGLRYSVRTILDE